MSFPERFVSEETGRGIVEYGLIAALIVAAAGAILTAFDDSRAGFNTLGNDLISLVR